MSTESAFNLGARAGLAMAIAELEAERRDRKRRGHPNMQRGIQIGIERLKRLEITDE